MTKTFHPPQRTLMGPGPSDVSPRVLSALSRPTIGHLDPAFIGLMDEIKNLLQDLLFTSNPLTLPVSAPGSAGMETVFSNLLEPGETVIVCQNGVFGGRMKENVERMGGVCVCVEEEWGKAVDTARVAKALDDHPEAIAVAVVHAETSTGACSDVKEIARLAREHGCLSIVDAVTSFGGVELRVDDWQIDALYTGTQKCLSCVPGLSPVTFSSRAVDKIRKRRSPVQSWFLDLNLVMAYWEGGSQRSYHHTAPVNSLYALHEALLVLQEEGLEQAWRRHTLHHQALLAGLEAIGLSLAVRPPVRLPQLNMVRVPEGIDEARVRSLLLEDWQLEIGAGLGSLAGRVWRIGLMGHACNRRNVLYCLAALENVLAAMDSGIHTGRAIPAARTVYEA